MTEFNCNKRCGICCIVTNASLTVEEYKSKKYKMAKTYKKFIKENIRDGRSGKSIKKRAKYIPQLNKLQKVCYYFDPYEKECIIYDERPSLCKAWDCSQEWSNGVAIKANWEKRKSRAITQ